MWLSALNGLAYVAYTLLSGEWRYLLPTRHSFAEAWQVVLHELGAARRCHRASSMAQQLAYTAVVLMGAGSLRAWPFISPPNWLG